MNIHILADYYEEKGFISKAKRLRRRNALVIYSYWPNKIMNMYSYANGRQFCYSAVSADLTFIGSGNAYTYFRSGKGFYYYDMRADTFTNWYGYKKY